MFGGVTFMVRGQMCVSAGKGRIMCRIDPALHDAASEAQGSANSSNERARVPRVVCTSMRRA